MNSIDPRGAIAACARDSVLPQRACAWRKGVLRALMPCLWTAMPACGAATIAEPVLDMQAAPGVPSMSAASTASPVPDWPESDTVLDLLRADARAAAQQRLGNAQQWLSPSGSVPVSARLSSHGVSGRDAQDSVDVQAIYGVGRVLHADVSVNGAMWRYRQGRHWPLGVVGQGGEPLYALVAIDLPCVRLRRRDDVLTACLRAEQAHD